MCRRTFDPRILSGTENGEKIGKFANFKILIGTNLTKFRSLKEQKVKIFPIFSTLSGTEIRFSDFRLLQGL